MKLSVLFCIGCFLTACADSTPRARIEKSPQQFQALPPEHREMVRSGKITQGMSMNAVYFAWGKPASITKETRKQQETTRWDYARFKPTFNDPDAYTSYARAFADPTSSDQLTTPKRSSRDPIPNRSATVWFVDGKVEEWERIR